MLVCVRSAKKTKGELTVTVNIERFMMKGFQTSGELMETVRALDYTAQYKYARRSISYRRALTGATG